MDVPYLYREERERRRSLETNSPSALPERRDKGCELGEESAQVESAAPFAAASAASPPHAIATLKV